ncbi:ABC transporter permease [Halomonas sp. S2151]|uniref:carbohydrate ABC transporter permease n=1 Tax=unclassified Halomonas TaxID=2609666 RepID=UPI0005F9C156|nr:MULTISPECIES: sugar ABC transporter permease [unclassified Halomonas]KJZ08062.1 ABC transporter permease [Halomonas sp. S2151]
MRRGRLLPYYLIAPSMLFMAALFLYPFVQIFAEAFTEKDGAIGLGNFSVIFHDFNFLPSLNNTLLLGAIVIPVQLVMAIAMALMVTRMNRGRSGALYIWTIPLGISDLAAGIIWLAILEQFGFFNSLLQAIGLIDAPIAWLTYQNPFALFIAVVIAEIWRGTAIMLIILVSGIGLIPKEYDEAGQIFGASYWQRLWKITLPMLRPSLQSALILRTLLAVEVFAVVMMLGGSDLPVLMSETFDWQFLYQQTGAASAYAVIIMLISVAATLVYLKLLSVPKEARG